MMNKKHSCFLDANRKGTQVRVFRGKKTDRIQERHECCRIIYPTSRLATPFDKTMIATDTHANRLYITHL